MMNKKKIGLVLLALTLAFTGCQKQNKVEEKDEATKQEQELQKETRNKQEEEEKKQASKESDKSQAEKVKSLTYSNLVDEESQAFLKETLMDAGIKEEKIDAFLEDVNHYNQTVENLSLVESGFKTIDSLIPNYNPELMQKWEEKNPEFFGHNCRLTNFRLFDDFIEVQNPIIGDDTMLFADKEVMESTQTIPKEKENQYLSYFSYVDTNADTDASKQLEVFQKSLKDKGIRFHNDKIHVVSVVFHMNIEDTDSIPQLFIGHAGLMWEDENKDIYFLEKISFSEPYQLDKFNNRQELSDYLMNKYDVDTTGSTASPFVLENDKLIEGYRANPDKDMQ